MHCTDSRRVLPRLMRLPSFLLLSMGFWGGQPADAADPFAATCSRIIHALQAGDWKAFRQEAADQVVFEMIDRIYLLDSHLSANTAKWLTASPGWIKGFAAKRSISLFGPAIEGKVASNFKWWVQLELVGDRWRVRKLITEAH